MKTIENILIEHNNKVIKKTLEMIKAELGEKPIMRTQFDDFISVYDVFSVIDKHIKEVSE